MSRRIRTARRAGLVLLGALTLTQLQGCFLLGAAAVGGTALVATDRRTTGSQLEDQTIQVKASSRINQALGGQGSVSVSSYNQQVLLTGQVPSAALKQLAAQVAADVPNVKSVANELEVGMNEALTDQANDTYLTSRVRAAFIDDKALYSQAFMITTCDSVVYLQGLVTPAEGAEAAAVASGISGVKKVVTLYQTISPAQLENNYSGQVSTPQQPPANPPAVAPKSSTP